MVSGSPRLWSHKSTASSLVLEGSGWCADRRFPDPSSPGQLSGPVHLLPAHHSLPCREHAPTHLPAAGRQHPIAAAPRLPGRPPTACSPDCRAAVLDAVCSAISGMDLEELFLNRVGLAGRLPSLQLAVRQAFTRQGKAGSSAQTAQAWAGPVLATSLHTSWSYPEFSSRREGPGFARRAERHGEASEAGAGRPAAPPWICD